MSGQITRGTTFTLGQQEVSVAVFVPVLTNATVANVDRDNIALTVVTPVTMQAAALDNPSDKEMWQDDITHALKDFQQIGSAGQGNWLSALSFGTNYSLSASSAAVVPGDILEPSGHGGDTGNQTYSQASSPSGNNFHGFAVAADSVLPGEAGVCVRHGPVKARSTGTINAGEAVRLSSTTAGTVESAGAAGTGYGPYVFAVALSAASGGYVWLNLRR